LYDGPSVSSLTRADTSGSDARAGVGAAACGDLSATLASSSSYSAVMVARSSWCIARSVMFTTAFWITSGVMPPETVKNPDCLKSSSLIPRPPIRTGKPSTCFETR
jgi:hypothetical protein